MPPKGTNQVAREAQLGQHHGQRSEQPMPLSPWRLFSCGFGDPKRPGPAAVRQVPAFP